MMVALGRLVESAIGKARHARVQVGSRGGVRPLLSLEDQLALKRVRDIIDAATQRVISDSIPDLQGGVALEVGEGPVLYGSRLLACQAGKVIGVEIGGASIGRQGDISRGYVIRGAASRLPFENGRFSYFLARMATVFQGDVIRAIREMDRVLARGGQGVLIDYHPFGPYATRGAGRLRPAGSGIRKFEDYYSVLKQSGLLVVNVREVFVDEQMRKLFHEDEVPAYRNLKGAPLLVFLFVYKPRGKT